MAFDNDFEMMISRKIKDPEHHKKRRETFQEEYHVTLAQRFGMRPVFGQRQAIPVTAQR